MTDRWTAVATLTDASRRALFDYVRRQRRPVHREEAAEATRMSRSLAAFHLDKLVEAGLLTARYEAPADRPRGRGRTPKVYEPAGTEVAVLIPERRYELIADILAEAVENGRPPAEIAHRHGVSLGTQLRHPADLPPGDRERADLPPGDRPPAVPGVVEVLAGLGFEPVDCGDVVRLGNCPFHALAVRHTALVCGVNHAFLTGLLDGLGLRDMEAVLAPHPPACCVELTRPAWLPGA